ncbi:hypothetical protein [Thermococcus chitonophagus]|uniref:Uncharacterized protein n=1 Tax=Thermococcus chitonophagus TaxID=54262 RepID=A0A160VSF0_9EURY|nr:hypothetical protein [Thermococcus chitonophagus]CUX77792.1 hypothetical protein CHITON_1013 [Thermococcus chitonophagus]
MTIDIYWRILGLVIGYLKFFLYEALASALALYTFTIIIAGYST